MPKLNPSICRVLVFTLFVSGTFADTVTLKNGEHLEGKITKETDKDITIEVKVSAGIVDEQVVQKADIEKIDKTSPEVEAFQAIAPIQLGKNSLPVAGYDAYIRALQAFVTQYPNSTRAADVQTTLNGFEEEKKRVQGGEVKIDGEWLSKARVNKEKVQIYGRDAYNYMVSQSAAGDHVGALNTFAVLEKSYAGATVMPDAVELARKLVSVLKGEVEQAILAQKAYKDNFDKGAAAASPTERADMAAAFKREQDAGDAAAASAESAGLWAPFNRHNAKSLTTLKAHAAKEESSLAKFDVEKMRESVGLAQTGQQSLASGDSDGANKALKEALNLWKDNELAMRLTKEASAQVKPVAATPAPATPVPATPKPKPTAKPSAAQQTSAPPAPAKEEDDRPFFMTLPGAVGIVAGLAVILGGANFLLKMKKRKAEQAE